MKSIYLIAALSFAASAAHGQPPQKSAAECDADNLGRYMNLSPKEFDQTVGEGWRVVGDKEGCEHAAADLIAMYRDEKLAQDIAGLDWHEAQLRAASGETDQALNLFRRNLVFKKKLAAEIGHQADVLYAEATIAYLERDRALLLDKRNELAATPKPSWYDALAADHMKRNAQSMPMTWPTNLNVVDGFVACFDRPYREAYSFACQPQTSQ